MLARSFMIPRSNNQEIAKAGKKALFRIYKEDPEGCPGASIYNAGYKCKWFR